MIYVLLAGIGVVSLWFLLYQARFRHPPLVRKLRDLRWEIRVGRDPRRILVRDLRSRHELLADAFHHAMYPVTGDARFIAGTRPYPISTFPYSMLKRYYQMRPTCQELLLALEREGDGTREKGIEGN